MRSGLINLQDTIVTVYHVTSKLQGATRIEGRRLFQCKKKFQNFFTVSSLIKLNNYYYGI